MNPVHISLRRHLLLYDQLLPSFLKSLFFQSLVPDAFTSHSPLRRYRIVFQGSRQKWCRSRSCPSWFQHNSPFYCWPPHSAGTSTGPFHWLEWLEYVWTPRLASNLIETNSVLDKHLDALLTWQELVWMDELYCSWYVFVKPEIASHSLHDLLVFHEIKRNRCSKFQDLPNTSCESKWQRNLP